MKQLIGTHDLALITIDTLRYDVADELARTGATPNLAAVLPDGRWERRHSPASFTYAAHHAFFAGFLPTPPDPGQHERLFAAAFPGSETSGAGTWVFDAPEVVTALAEAGYHTLCLGGVGFFNLRSPLGRVLPSLFAEAHWRPEFGVTEAGGLGAQLNQLEDTIASLPPHQPLFTFLNIASVHQPNRHYLPGAADDCLESHAAALSYVDGELPRLFKALSGRGRPCFVVACSDHGTAYGEDGHHGHRIAHEVVWTVPYAEFTLGQ
jgi:sulfatase-like protein